MSSKVEPRAHLGDFMNDEGGHAGLTECPLCALDPRRTRQPFTPSHRPPKHFLEDHTPDDIGRPIEELLVKYQLGGVSDRGGLDLIGWLAFAAAIIALGLIGWVLNTEVATISLP